MKRQTKRLLKDNLGDENAGCRDDQWDAISNSGKIALVSLWFSGLDGAKVQFTSSPRKC